MMKITFKNDDVARDYIAGLLNCGMHTINSPESLDDKALCVIGNDVYFVM